MKINDLIKELKIQKKKYGNIDVEIQAYLNDEEKYGDRFSFFGLYPYAIDTEGIQCQIYCEDCEYKEH